MMPAGESIGRSGARVPLWERKYVRCEGLQQRPGTAVLQQLPPGSSIDRDCLQRVASDIFGHPKELSQAVTETAQLISRSADIARQLLIGLVRFAWIEEYAEPPGFSRPIFIIAAPRSGSNLLFEQLCKVDGLWNIGDESHDIFDRVLQHDFRNPRFDSIRATQSDATPERTREIIDLFARRLLSSTGVRYRDLPAPQRPAAVRVLDKLPKNSFRVAFLNAAFPDALFIFLVRDPRENISSIMEAWREGQASGRFVTYRELPDTGRKNWCLVLPPGWRRVVDGGLAEIAAFQWASANDTALGDLLNVPRERWCMVSYRELVARPAATLSRLCGFIGMRSDPQMTGMVGGELALSRTVLTPPHPGKWRKNAADIERVLPSIAPTAHRIGQEMTNTRPSPATAANRG